MCWQKSTSDTKKYIKKRQSASEKGGEKRKEKKNKQ